MRVIILSGSPKGELSVTLKYARVLPKWLPQQQWEFIDIGKQIENANYGLGGR